MTQRLDGKKALVLVSSGVDETAMSMLQRELLHAGATIKTVGTEPGLVNSWNDKAWGLYFPVDIQISQALGSDFDLLIVPSGARGIRKLSANPHAERILSSFLVARKPVCLMGDAFELLVNTGHAGHEKSANVMTGECAGEVPAFLQKMIAHFTGGEPMKIAA
ncbi:MAG: DJ-1/PfpI family protein [Pseudomonadota bacterium]